MERNNFFFKPIKLEQLALAIHLSHFSVEKCLNTLILYILIHIYLCMSVLNMANYRILPENPISNISVSIVTLFSIGWRLSLFLHSFCTLSYWCPGMVTCNLHIAMHEWHNREAISHKLKKKRERTRRRANSSILYSPPVP